MSFSRAQQGQFRPLVEQAWYFDCKRTKRDPLDKAGRRFWYEEELMEATGKHSTAECDQKRDYEDAMAHFEAIVGASIYWQMRRLSGDRRRILHEVQQLAQKFDCDDDYMRGIARQALKRETIPEWRDLGPEDLLCILRALKIQVRRQERRGDPTDHPRRLEEDPF